MALPLVGAVVALSILLPAGTLDAPSDGLANAGRFVRIGLPVFRVLHDVAAAVTIGLLLTVAALVPGRPAESAGGLPPVSRYAMALAARTATAWWALSLLVGWFTYAELAGLALPQTASLEQWVFFARDLELGRALALSMSLVLVVAVGAWLAETRNAVGWLLGLALAALVPLAFAGHTGSPVNHALAVDSLVIHLVAVSLWVGGLVALLVLRHRLGPELAVTARRFSRVAGWCFVAVVVSGMGSAYARVGGLPPLDSLYGQVLALKLGAAAVLGLLGLSQRRRVLARLGSAALVETQARRHLTRLLAVEAVVMVATIGLGVALARTPPPPVGSTSGPSVESPLGSPLPPPLTPSGWVTSWQTDWLWVALAGCGVVLYLLAFRRLTSRGDRWPWGRTVSWLAGWALVVWATSGAPGEYGRVLFSMHMVQHMTIAMISPILLVLAAPVTLALRTLRPRTDGSRGVREWLLVTLHSRVMWVLTRPVVVGLLVVGSLVAFYFSPIFDFSLRTHVGHVLMTLHFLLAGYLFAWVICGPDPGPPRPPYPLRLVLLMAVMAAHAFIAIALMSSTTVLAADWFSALGRRWGGSLVEDQNLGTSLGWALGDVPIALLAVAMAVAWARSDEREARRYDRQADRDGDAELAAYNEWLTGLDAPARTDGSEA